MAPERGGSLGLPGRPWRVALIIAVACVVPAALSVLQEYLQGRIANQGSPPWQEVLWQASEWLILGALTPLTYVLGRRFPLRRPRLARSLAVHVTGAVTLCVLWAASGVALRWALGTNQRDITVGQDLASWTLTSLPWSVFMYFAVLGCVHAFSYFVEARERESQAARLAAQVAEARLSALRMQLHPHFLFNSLNAIAVLVRDRDTVSATRMLELLSDLLRQVLRADASHEIALGDELLFVERYLAIEQVRFSDRLTVRFEVDDQLRDAAVPAFVLQPLVENAIRHGFAGRPGPGHLDVVARSDGDQLVLIVRDDGRREIGSERSDTGAGLGLANTRERLQTLYGLRARLDLELGDAGGTTATVRLPLHRLTSAGEGGGSAHA